MRRLERAKCLLRVGETGSLLMHGEKHSWVALLYPDLLLLMDPLLHARSHGSIRLVVGTLRGLGLHH